MSYTDAMAIKRGLDTVAMAIDRLTDMLAKGSTTIVYNITIDGNYVDPIEFAATVDRKIQAIEKARNA